MFVQFVYICSNLTYFAQMILPVRLRSIMLSKRGKIPDNKPHFLFVYCFYDCPSSMMNMVASETLRAVTLRALRPRGAWSEWFGITLLLYDVRWCYIATRLIVAAQYQKKRLHGHLNTMCNTEWGMGPVSAKFTRSIIVKDFDTTRRQYGDRAEKPRNRENQSECFGPEQSEQQ